MFEDLSFRYKLFALPVVATLAFLLILLVTLWLGKRNDGSLALIEAGYYPAVELNRGLEQSLVQIQRGLEDAVADRDLAGLMATETYRDDFLAQLDDARQNPVIEAGQLERLAASLTGYYGLAQRARISWIAACFASMASTLSAPTASPAMRRSLTRCANP